MRRASEECGDSLSEELLLLGEADEMLEDPDDGVDVDYSSSEEGKSSSYQFGEVG